MPEPRQNELIRLLPAEETDQNFAIEVCELESVYFVRTVFRNGAIFTSIECSSLREAFATVADLLVAAGDREYIMKLRDT